jgi:PAS domain S-box-containing protein
VTGYTASEIQGKNPRILQGTLTDKMQLAILRTAMKQGKAAQVELLNYRKDGTPFWNEMDVVPVIDANGKFTHCIALQRDVTERKRVETEIQRYARELKQKNQALVAALAAARESTELKSRFLANMSHEIRTPMNGIIGMIDLLLTTKLNIEQQEYADSVRLSANSLLVVINDILDISRIEAGKLELDCVSFDLKTLVEEAVSPLAVTANSKGIRLQCDVARGIPNCVFGDPARIRQVITNLVGNAVKFTDEGRVIVTVGISEATAETVSIQVAVKDTGIGIPDDQCARLFHRFSQADNSSKRKHGGSGLGLAISRELVELMGGRIGVETEAGKGSMFWFTLTLPTERLHTPLLSEQSEDVFDLPAKPATKRILVAEDNEVNRRIALRILEKSGFEAEAVGNGRLALEALKKDHYDLVLMDVQMPDMDGFETTTAIRKLDTAVREIPIIAMTANAMSGDRERCIASGMDDYISKPVNLSQLRSTLERWIQKNATTRESLAHP